MYKLIFIMLISLNALAGRPVMHSIDRSELIQRSNFIFVGWPSPQKPSNICPNSLGNFQVHKVFKGDKSFEGKIISIAPNNYRLYEEYKGSKMPSYAQTVYGDGSLNMEQSSSILFANIRNDDCIELSANGAQEHRFKEREIEAITGNSCENVIDVIDRIVSDLPKNCEVDSDCVLKNFHADNCKDQQVYNINAEKKLDNGFQTLKNAFYKNCQNYLNTRGACAPVKSPPFYCKNKTCALGVAPEKLPKITQFKKATIHSSCAPHDAGSHMIVLKNENGNFPYFSINWWGKYQPTNLPGIYELSRANKNDYNHNFCLAESVCDDLKSLSIKVKIDQKDKNLIEYDLETKDGVKIKGNLDLQFNKTQHEMCG